MTCSLHPGDRTQQSQWEQGAGTALADVVSGSGAQGRRRFDTCSAEPCARTSIWSSQAEQSSASFRLCTSASFFPQKSAGARCAINAAYPVALWTLSFW